CFFFQAEDGIRDFHVTGVQTCALPIYADGRRHILGIHTRTMPLADDVDLDDLAARTERYTGADLEDLVRRAGLTALRESMSIERVTAAHFEQALKETRASVTPEMEREYEQMLGTLKQERPQRQPIGFVRPHEEG